MRRPTKAIAAAYGVPVARFTCRNSGDFLEKRPAFVRQLAEQWLNTSPGVEVSVRRADGGTFVVDGFDDRVEVYAERTSRDGTWSSGCLTELPQSGTSTANEPQMAPNCA